MGTGGLHTTNERNADGLKQRLAGGVVLELCERRERVSRARGWCGRAAYQTYENNL